MKNGKRLLVIGASILQLPAIKKARSLGYYIGVVDYNPKAIGVSLADEYFCISTIDIEGIVNTAKRFRPDGIITIATDMPIRAIAKACEVCGLPGISYDTAVKATDKGEMIKAFEKNGVEHPWYLIAPSLEVFLTLHDRVKFPCIMKPADNAGSRGVVLCQDWDELKEQYEYSCNESRGGTVIIEEYLRGPEFSVEVMVIDGMPHVLQITDKMTTGVPHFVEMGHSQPTRQTGAQINAIMDLARRATKAIGINCGPAHIEMILTDKGPKMVELGARMGGDCITTHLVPLSTGIDMVEAMINIACGKKPDISRKFSKGAAIRYLEAPIGKLKNISGIEEAKKIDGVQDIVLVHQAGEMIGEIRSSTDRIGFVIAQALTAENAILKCEQAIRRIKIEVE